MPKKTIQTPVFNNTAAPTGGSVIAGAAGTIQQIGDTIQGNSTAGGTIDKLRQFVIFELVDVRHGESAVVQNTATFPYMVLHVNPNSFEESFTKVITRQITRGGYLEQHWGEELDQIACNGSTGMFITTTSGLAALNRKASIAYRKYLELVAVYRNNGLVYDQRGNVIFNGSINLHFDSNIYNGYFENMVVNETAENPFTFDVSFTFKVKHSFRTVGR